MGDDEIMIQSIPLDDMITEVVTTQRNYFIHLDSEIEDATKYRQIIEVLSKCSGDDVVRFLINTPGGYMSTAIQLLDFMLNTKAKTIADVYQAYSAGSMLMLGCDEINFKPYSSVMIHTISSGCGGKVSEMTSYHDFLKQQTRDLMFKIYSGFLIQDEIEEVLRGTDIWLNEYNCNERIKHRIKMRNR